MKHRFKIPALAILASFSFLMPLAAQSTAPGDVYGVPEDITARVDSDLRNCEFDRRDEFVAVYEAKHTQLSTKLEQLRSNHSAALANPKRNAAMAELDEAAAAFEQKLDEAKSASEETWTAARDSVAATWDKLQTIYDEVSGTG